MAPRGEAREASDWFADPWITRLRRTLEKRRTAPAATQGASLYAAVALVLRPGAAGDPEVLLVQRAERAGDPWSGHIALPGGRRHAEDRSLEETAVRETREETAIDLVVDGEMLGELNEVAPFMVVAPTLTIQPFVAVVHRDVVVEPNAEIAKVLWTPVAVLVDPTTTGEAEIFVAGQWRTQRVFRVGDHVVWGLTERILREFLEVLGAE